MDASHPGSFFEALLARRAEWRGLPVVEVRGDTWQGLSLTVPAPPGSDLAGGLAIEAVGDEVTVGLDYAHIHVRWPPEAPSTPAIPAWSDPLAMIEAIIGEVVVASSGWIDGRLRVGSLHEADRPPDLHVPNLRRVRVRSWCGTHDRDEMLPATT